MAVVARRLVALVISVTILASASMRRIGWIITMVYVAVVVPNSSLIPVPVASSSAIVPHIRRWTTWGCPGFVFPNEQNQYQVKLFHYPVLFLWFYHAEDFVF